MLTHSQAQLVAGTMDGQRASPRLPQAAAGSLPPRPPRPRRTNNQIQLVEVDVDPALFMNRHNNLPEALGKFRRVRICGQELLYANDSWAWYIPSGMTFWIVVGNIVVAWSIIGWASLIVVVTLVTTGFTASYLATCTDPGIYPRLKPGEADPLAAYEDLVYCRVCQLRRPPRTSHCYQCNVCVLAADHHCGVIGGCIGQRTLRWFTLFLVCQSTACCIGVYWLFYFFFTTVYEVANGNAAAVGGVPPSLSVISTTELPPHLAGLSKRRLLRHQKAMENMDMDFLGLRHVGAVFMLLIDFVIIALVGGLAVMYVYLTVSSTTRRESQRRENSFKICCKPAKMIANIMETAFPPASLVLGNDSREPVDVVVDGATEGDRLV